MTESIIKIYEENGGMAVEVNNFTTSQVATAWTAMTNTLIKIVEKAGTFKGGRREALHGMVDVICNNYEKTKEENEETKEELKKTKFKSFEDFKEDFFEKMPETREFFESSDLLTQVILTSAMQAAYKTFVEGRK